MKDHLTSLKSELKQAGATPKEVAELSSLAEQLSSLKGLNHEQQAPRQRMPRLLMPLAGAAMGVVACFALVITSQAASPTSALYPVQKFSDNVAIAVHPSYRASVMMKRSQQVNTLVAAHASSDKVLATLNDYTRQAKAYESMPHANYAAFEFCKVNLRQAASVASPTEKYAIEASMQSLEII